MTFLKKRADTTLLPPLPRVLTPSGSFEGDDGKWSTFIINIAGDGEGAGQNFRVLISTSSPITMVPAQGSWCNADCAKGRGILSFNNQQQPLGLDTTVTRWKQAGIYTLPTPEWWSDDYLLFPVNGTGEVYGLTTVGLGAASKTSITFDNQYVASTISRNSYLGSLGLAVGEFSPASASLPTFFSSFAGATEYMASPSYGYTAGALYRRFLLDFLCLAFSVPPWRLLLHFLPILSHFAKNRSNEAQGTTIEASQETWYSEDTIDPDILIRELQFPCRTRGTTV